MRIPTALYIQLPYKWTVSHINYVLPAQIWISISPWHTQHTRTDGWRGTMTLSRKPDRSSMNSTANDSVLGDWTSERARLMRMPHMVRSKLTAWECEYGRSELNGKRNSSRLNVVTVKCIHINSIRKWEEKIKNTRGTSRTAETESCTPTPTWTKPKKRKKYRSTAHLNFATETTTKTLGRHAARRLLLSRPPHGTKRKVAVVLFKRGAHANKINWSGYLPQLPTNARWHLSECFRRRIPKCASIVLRSH